MFCIFRLIRPTLLFVSLLALTLPQRAGAQSFSLDTTTFYADSALVHTGLAVRWTGALSWGTMPSNTAYSLIYSFGDGTGYTVSKVTGNSAGGTDTFQAIHTYGSAGSYTARVVLKNASGTAIDSLVRPGIADSGYVVSGQYYYDCTRNCAIDTGELWMGKTWLRYKVGSQYRKCLTDSLGYYSIAIPTGDTFYRTPASANIRNTTAGSCVWAPITATDRAAHVALWLSEKIRITNFQASPYVCLGSFYQIGVTGIQESGNLWSNPLKVLFKAGNGAQSPYGSGGGSQFDWHFIYPASGTYTVAAEMYLADYSGPYMRLQKVVQVDTCKPIQLRPYFDINKNCVADTAAGESGTRNANMVLRSQMRGTQYVSAVVSTPSVFDYLLYPGDTVQVDTLINVNTNPNTNPDTAALRRTCTGLILTEASPALVRLPYNPHIAATGVTGTSYFCYSDTARLLLAARLIGYAPGSQFKLVSIWGDGTVDSSTFTSSLDTVSLPVRHRYTTPGDSTTCRFVLKAANGDVDTFEHTLYVNDCYNIKTRVFIDANKNCLPDTGETFLSAYNVTLGSGGSTFYSNTLTGILNYTLSGATSDSFLTVSRMAGTAVAGKFHKSVNAMAGCPWPVLAEGGPTQLLLPLIDTPTLTYSYTRAQPTPCASASAPVITLGINTSSNYNLPYKVVHYAGDGLQKDTFLITATAPVSLSLPQRRFINGTYQPAIHIWSGSTGGLHQTLTPPPFTIFDTCTTARGYLFADADGDCMPGTPDMPLGGQPVTLTPGNGSAVQTVLTNTAGRFYANLGAGTSYTATRPAHIFGSLEPACGTVATAPLTLNTTGIYPYNCATSNDLSLLMSHHYFKPGSPDTLLLYAGGTQCYTGSGMLTLTLPADLLFTGSNLPNPPAVSGATHTWTFDTLSKLPPVIWVGVDVAAVPAAPVLCLSAQITGTAIDSLLANNDFDLCDSVRADIPALYKSQSSDSMTAAGALLPDKEIIYSLRVRNTGASALQHIIIYDSLSTQLHLGSLHLMDASFPATLSLLPGGVLRVSSNGAATVLPGGDAAVRFGIRPVSGLTTSVLIPNKASVVIDGMATGTTNTTVATAPPASGNGGSGSGVVSGIGHEDEPLVYPVPVPEGMAAFLRLPVPSAARYEIVDLTSRRYSSGACTGTLTRLAVPGVPGFYLVRVYLEGILYTRKLVVTGGN